MKFLYSFASDIAEGKPLKIIRVLNTNAVVTLDLSGREVILTGPGIGFSKKKGDCLDEKLVDKTYCLQSGEASRRLQDIVCSVSERYLEIAGKVVDEARNQEGLKVNDILYVTLTDHINSALERYQAGIFLKNMMKIDIRKFYPREYAVARKAVTWIKEDTGIDLGEDEAAFIAMHITASELEGSACSQLQNITDLISSILQIIRLHFKIQFHEYSVSYQRFITHLKFFSARIFDRTPYQDTMQEIYQVLVSQNEHAYSGVKKVADLIKRQYDYTLSMDEQLYLLIHLKRILDEEQET